MTVGHMAHMAMVKSAAASETSWALPNRTSPRGNQASGETGRRTWKVGSKVLPKSLEEPRRKPSGVPTRMAQT